MKLTICFAYFLFISILFLIQTVSSLSSRNKISYQTITLDDENQSYKANRNLELYETENRKHYSQKSTKNRIDEAEVTINSKLYNSWRHRHHRLTQNPDEYLTAPQLIQKYGYPVEIHSVTTEDGYIISMHRIPHGKNEFNSRSNGNRPVVFLQHGMFGTSADWIMNSPDKCLAYALADAGYDVFLGNARGNTYSRKHTTLSPNSYSFWKFGWHEMGYYDLKAEIDYVLNITGENKLHYVGHSMGTTMFFVLISTRPEYNDKIQFMAALGPAVFLNNTKSGIKVLAKYYGRTERYILDILGHGVLLPEYLTKVLNKLAPELCTPELEIDKLCEEIVFLLAGHDPAQTNYTQLPVVLAHEPSTVSTRTGFHYFQNIRSGEFQYYDFGYKKNQKFYDDTIPPSYDLQKVKLPIGLFWAQNDHLCDPVDVKRLSETLPNVVINHRVNFTLFNHVDFIFAKDADILVNKPVMEALRQF